MGRSITLRTRLLMLLALLTLLTGTHLGLRMAPSQEPWPEAGPRLGQAPAPAAKQNDPLSPERLRRRCRGAVASVTPQLTREMIYLNRKPATYSTVRCESGKSFRVYRLIRGATRVG